ncbi:MAG TPA: ATP-binding protein [Xanthomonadaceae bacterium]|jgi:signal transduction histidine kinase/CheY-like chemotaxis protein/HPt (histidine-containing phosphotransfer) domain-containing protein
MPKSSPLLTTLRWITLATIAGTVVALGIDLGRGVRGPWLVVALTLGVLSFVCCATALHLLNIAIQQASASARKATNQAAEANHQVDEQSAQFDSMRSQLEEYRRLQEELTQAKQAAEQATLAKSEFLATMSHEVRTPLNGIIPMLDLLQSSKLALDQREILNTALQSARQLLRIVDDILDYSKLEANKLQLESVSLNLRDTLDSVIRLLERQAQAKGLRLTLHIETDVRRAFRGDPVRIRQVISNLVSNALKFTERGSITVHVARLKETRTHHQLRLEVRDTGVGISPEAASKLFSAFSQADASTTRVYGGTGLGLAICKRIVDLMGGRIGVESELGRGSTFWFEIPMLKASSEIEGPRTGLQGARLLVLTSEGNLQKRIGASLDHTGAHLTFAENTQEALNQLRAFAASAARGFDVLIVDLSSIKHTIVALYRNLASMDGVERLRILFLESSDPVPDDARALPNAVVVQRTVAEADLRPKLAELMAGEAISTAGRDTRAAVSLAPASEQGAESEGGGLPRPLDEPIRELAPIKGKLLLVEDNPVNLLVAQRLISLIGTQCETAENGEQALEKMTRGHYDIVLMDCQMPVMDGYTATRTWRVYEAENQLRPLPIIAMTANAMAGDRQKCLDAGMDDYLSKPVARDQLEAMLRRWIDTPSRLRRQPPAPAAWSTSATPAQNKIIALTPAEIAEAGMKHEEATALFVAEVASTGSGSTAAVAIAAPAMAVPASARSAPDFAVVSPAPPSVQPHVQPPAPPPEPAPAAVTTAAVATAAVATPAPAPEEPVAAAPANQPATPALDSEIIEDLWSAMGDAFTELVNVFLEDAPNHLTKLDAASASGNMAGLVGPAHALKSSSANLGAMQLSAIARQIEHGARDKSLVDPVATVKQLRDEFLRAEAELRTLLH